MNYLLINNIDFSYIVNELKINKKHIYNSQTNAAGNTVVDLINDKLEVEVGFIPLKDADMKKLLTEVNKFNVSIKFLNPDTNLISNDINCIVDTNELEYMTIIKDKVRYKAFTLKFIEL